MSNLPYYAYPGVGEFAQKTFHYSQAVRVGDRIICAGQGGWDISQPGMSIPEDINAEIDLAFANVEHNLKDAGGKGWSQVYKVVTYSTDVPSQQQRMVENAKKWMPDHAPVWTLLGVKQLGTDKMHFEVEVEAYDEEGAAAARKAKAT